MLLWYVAIFEIFFILKKIHDLSILNLILKWIEYVNMNPHFRVLKHNITTGSPSRQFDQIYPIFSQI